MVNSRVWVPGFRSSSPSEIRPDAETSGTNPSNNHNGKQLETTRLPVSLPLNPALRIGLLEVGGGRFGHFRAAHADVSDLLEAFETGQSGVGDLSA